MLVELDLRPDTPGMLYRPNEGDLPEIPTIKSDIEQLKDVLTALPLRSIATSLDKAAAGFGAAGAGAPGLEHHSDRCERLAHPRGHQVSQIVEVGESQLPAQALSLFHI